MTVRTKYDVRIKNGKFWSKFVGLAVTHNVLTATECSWIIPVFLLFLLLLKCVVMWNRRQIDIQNERQNMYLYKIEYFLVNMLNFIQFFIHFYNIKNQAILKMTTSCW